MKKIYLILFFLTLAIGIQAQSGTYPANGLTWKYTLNGSNATITGVVETTSTDLNIPNTIVVGGNSYPVKAIKEKAFYVLQGLNGTLTIPSSVTTIGKNAFRACINLTGALIIPNSVTSIDEDAFNGCQGFTSLTIPSSVITIGKRAFTGCRNLTGALIIPNSVTSIGEEAFSSCLGFTSLILSNSLTEIKSGTFYGNWGLVGSLVLPNSITSIGDNAFAGLKITSLTLPDNLVTIGNNAFERCYKLTSMSTLPNSVTTIGSSAFLDCHDLTGTLTLPNGLISIGDKAFYRCEKITGSLVIPNSVTYLGRSAFEKCKGFSGTLTLSDNLTRINEGAFLNCSGFIGTLNIPNGVTSIGSRAFFDCKGFSDLIIPSSLSKIESQGFYAAIRGGIRKDFIIPKTITEIGDYAFAAIGNAKTITFEAGSNVTFGRGVFYQTRLDFIDMTQLPPITQAIGRKNHFSPFEGAYPEVMIYLPSGSVEPDADEENFVLDGQCKKFVVYDRGSYGECNYVIKYPFTAITSTYVDRAFEKNNSYYYALGECRSICLPYPSTLPDGLRAYKLTKKNVYGRESFMFTSIGDGGTILQANTPYLIRMLDYANHVFGTENNVQVPVTPSKIEIQATSDGGTFFGGTMTRIDNSTASAGGFYNLKYDQWRPITTANPNGYVRPLRAYIRTTGGTPAKGFAIVLDDENETTGIDNAEEDIEKGEGKIYSLDGKLLGTDVDALKSGEIYIKNGKKFYKF